MNADQFLLHVGTVVNEALKDGVPAVQVCSIMDMLKVELQMRIISYAVQANSTKESPGSPIIHLPGTRKDNLN